MSRGGRAGSAVLLAGALAAWGQEPPEEASSSPPVVRVTTEIVQVDAIVTDRDGRHVTDLKAEDFEVREDGQEKEVILCTFVSTTDPLPRPPLAPGPRPRGSARPPREVRRSFAFVVDDLSLSFESTVRVRTTLTRFVDGEMRPGDLVAIVRTGAGLGSLQQFTSDSRVLRAAIDRVRFNIIGTGRARGSFAPLGPAGGPPAAGGPGAGAQAAAAASTSAFNARAENNRQVLLASGTLGALRYVVRGLAALPGRKSMLVFSDGFPLHEIGFSGERNPGPVLQAVQSVVEEANRSSVVLYAVDARGLMTLRGDASGGGGGSAARLDEERAGLAVMTQDTGGVLLADTNDLSEAVGRVIEDQKGYYLVGYAPDPRSFALEEGRPRYHRLSVKVKRRGLVVRSRRGFYGVAAPEAPRITGEPASMVEALYSPFAAGDVAVSLTCLFAQVEGQGQVIRALVHLDEEALSFEDTPEGGRRAAPEFAVLVFDADGRIVGHLARTHDVRREPPGVGRRPLGVVFNLDLPVSKPGGYEFRIAVRDPPTGRLGSASQFILVPDLKKNRLALSGIVMSGDPQETDGHDLATVSALRRFPQGSKASYAFMVYNARRATAGPDLESQLSLLQEGRELVSLPAGRITSTDPSPTGPVATGGQLTLPVSLEPGSYTLQVAVRDRSRKEGRDSLALQWMDFELVARD